MNITIFGGAGYLGGALTELLIKNDHNITVFDNLTFGKAAIEPFESKPNFKLIKADMRDISVVSKAIKDKDAVIVLAALVGEPACDKNPDETLDINYLATINIAECAAFYEIKRFIFASTDSCYGAQEKIFLKENSPLAPISLYAELKAKVEKKLLEQKFHNNMKAVILRMATLYGLAPRMRFDLVINLLCREAVVGKGAKIFSGEQWRPFVHVRDAAKAFKLALEAPAKLVEGEVFNVGSNHQNVQFKDLSSILEAAIPQAQIETIPQAPDLRDYHVCFDKISEVLSFKPDYELSDGIKEIQQALLNGNIKAPYEAKYKNA